MSIQKANRIKNKQPKKPTQTSRLFAIQLFHCAVAVEPVFRIFAEASEAENTVAEEVIPATAEDDRGVSLRYHGAPLRKVVRFCGRAYLRGKGGVWLFGIAAKLGNKTAT